LSESGGVLAITTTGLAASRKTQSVSYPAVFNNINLQIDIDVQSNPTDLTIVPLLGVYKDANNSVMVGWVDPYNTAQRRVVFWKHIAGVVTEIASVNVATNTVVLYLERSGDDFSAYYDDGGGKTQIGATQTLAIGADCRVIVEQYIYQKAGTGPDSVVTNFNDLEITGSGIYWDTKSDSSAIKTTYNEQTIDEDAGGIIQFGSATFTQGSNMTYDYKIGTGAWVLGKTSAQIIALGDQITDDGKFNLRAVYGGSTAQASWTSLSVPTAPGIPRRRLRSGVHIGHGRSGLKTAPSLGA